MRLCAVVIDMSVTLVTRIYPCKQVFLKFRLHQKYMRQCRNICRWIWFFRIQRQNSPTCRRQQTIYCELKFMSITKFYLRCLRKRSFTSHHDHRRHVGESTDVPKISGKSKMCMTLSQICLKHLLLGHIFSDLATKLVGKNDDMSPTKNICCGQVSGSALDMSVTRLCFRWQWAV